MKLKLTDWLLSRKCGSVAQEAHEVNQELVVELKRLEDNLLRAAGKKKEEPPDKEPDGD